MWRNDTKFGFKFGITCANEIAPIVLELDHWKVNFQAIQV